MKSRQSIVNCKQNKVLVNLKVTAIAIHKNEYGSKSNKQKMQRLNVEEKLIIIEEIVKRAFIANCRKKVYFL